MTAMNAADFTSYLKNFDGDLRRLQGVMHARLGSQVAMIKDMEDNSYFTGGKQLRALVALLAARLCGAPQDTGDKVAAAIEFIHTATLLHDDVVDEAPVRRHLPAAAQVYGSAAAVLAGDFLYSRASQILAQLNNLRLLQHIADVTNRLAEGELLQLLNRGKPDVDEETYSTIINYKTANLFSAAAAAGAILQGADETALAAYGMHLGSAFQLVDDCLDYEGEGEALGKKIGADFSEGKMTLPVILLLAKSDDAARQTLMRQWQDGGDDFTAAAARLRESGALADVRARAGEHIQAALAALAPYPPGEEKTALMTLAQMSLHRDK